MAIQLQTAETRRYRLDGLDCPNCAEKIEKAVQKLDNVESATVAFTTQQLMVKGREWTILEKNIDLTVQKVESDVRLQRVDTETDEHAAKPWFMFARQGVAAALLAGAIWLPLPQWRLALFIVAYLVAGFDVVYKAIRRVVSGQMFDEYFLMSIASIGAMAIGEYPEAVAVMIFYQVGEGFQDLAVARSRKSISALLDIRPDVARVIEPNGVLEMNPADVRVGQRLLVQPGERIPLDAIVLEGTADADTAVLTGESHPRVLEPGAEALAGMIVMDGRLVLEVTKPYAQSTVSRILEMVQEASERKSNAERFITRFARIYTPAVVGCAALLAVVPPLIAGDWNTWIYRALMFLVASCPCALVVSVPLTSFAGLGGASRQGILIKGGHYLEALHSVDTVVLDKTGTLTEGKLHVSTVAPETGVLENQLLEAAALGEAHSHHPVAVAIRNRYAEIGASLPKMLEYREISGRGTVVTDVSGHQIVVGNHVMLEEMGIAHSISDSNSTITYIARDGQYLGWIGFEDRIKADSASAVAELKQMGCRVVMVSGDRETQAMQVARQLGIDEVLAERLPEQKVESFEMIHKGLKKGKKTMFVGDGINDAPVLARADVGVAMNGLADAAIEVADVVLMSNQVSQLVTAFRIARKTHRIVIQNIAFALAVKGIVLVLGALGYAPMAWAVFADVGVALIAVLNALRAMR